MVSKDDLFLRGTLSLADDFVRVSKSYESANYADILHNPFWWVAKRLWGLRGHRERRIRDLRRKRSELVRELHTRYEGVLLELFTQERPAVEFGDYLKQLWHHIQIAVLSLDDSRRFSTVLWQVHCRLGAEIRAIRPKFMLRQFVDEMPDDSPRTTLRLLAYGNQYEVLDNTSETMRYVWQAYPLLHVEVLRRLAELDLLTDNELDGDFLVKLKEPHSQYHFWLFRWKDDPSRS